MAEINVNTLKGKSVTISMFLGSLLQSHVQAKVFHTQVKGIDRFAIHLALDEYVASSLIMYDELTEAYQGINDVVVDYPNIVLVNYISKETTIKYFEDYLKFIEDNRLKIFTDSALINQVDELKTLVHSLLYKLKRL